METTLTIIAVLSTTAAFSLGAMLVKMLRDERRRSDARVQSLMDVAGVDYLAATVREPADKLVPSHFHAIPEGHERPAAKRAKPLTRKAPADRRSTFQDLELNPRAPEPPSSRAPELSRRGINSLETTISKPNAVDSARMTAYTRSMRSRMRITIVEISLCCSRHGAEGGL